MGNRLYVGNLSFEASAEGVREAFAAAGTVEDVYVVTDRVTGRSRGFAFVTMSTEAEAQQAIQTLNGAMLDGRALRVNEAEDRPRGGGFGGGGRGGPGGGGGGGGFGGGGSGGGPRKPRKSGGSRRTDKRDRW
jgi:RNA recognition motif-containing protein